MTRTRVMSPGNEGGMRILCKAPRTIHLKPPWSCFAGVGASTEAGTRRPVVSVESETIPGDAVPGNAVPGDAVPGDAVPGDAVPGDAVPGDAVPGEVIPRDAVPDQGVPGEQRPENTAEQRILPLQRRTKKNRVQRAREAVRGPESAIGTGYGSRVRERADQEPTRQEPGAGRRIARHGQGGGVCVEQPAAIRYRVGENLAAVPPVLLRRADKERLDLIRGEGRAALQEESRGSRHDGGRHRRSGETEVRRSVLRHDDAIGEQRIQGASRHAQGNDAPSGCDQIGLRIRVGAAPGGEPGEQIIARPTVPRSSVAPTVITYGSMPGVTTVSRCGPPFPDAATTTRPRRHAISTAADIGSTR